MGCRGWKYCRNSFVCYSDGCCYLYSQKETRAKSVQADSKLEIKQKLIGIQCVYRRGGTRAFSTFIGLLRDLLQDLTSNYMTKHFQWYDPVIDRSPPLKFVLVSHILFPLFLSTILLMPMRLSLSPSRFSLPFPPPAL